jgi:hypothetical protein
MLADLTLLLHEVTDALRGRRDVPPFRVPTDSLHARSRTILVTGTPSPGKARLVGALNHALEPDGIAVNAPDQHESGGNHSLHVHAESDIDALLESRPGSEGAWARRADLLVPVDWEGTAHSVRRVVDALIARGVAVGDRRG